MIPSGSVLSALSHALLSLLAHLTVSMLSTTASEGTPRTSALHLLLCRWPIKCHSTSPGSWGAFSRICRTEGRNARPPACKPARTPARPPARTPARPHAIPHAHMHGGDEGAPQCRRQRVASSGCSAPSRAAGQTCATCLLNVVLPKAPLPRVVRLLQHLHGLGLGDGHQAGHAPRTGGGRGRLRAPRGRRLEPLEHGRQRVVYSAHARRRRRRRRRKGLSPTGGTAPAAAGDRRGAQRTHQEGVSGSSSAAHGSLIRRQPAAPCCCTVARC